MRHARRNRERGAKQAGNLGSVSWVCVCCMKAEAWEARFVCVQPFSMWVPLMYHVCVVCTWYGKAKAGTFTPTKYFSWLITVMMIATQHHTTSHTHTPSHTHTHTPSHTITHTT